MEIEVQRTKCDISHICPDASPSFLLTNTYALQVGTILRCWYPFCVVGFPSFFADKGTNSNALQTCVKSHVVFYMSECFCMVWRMAAVMYSSGNSLQMILWVGYI